MQLSEGFCFLHDRYVPNPQERMDLCERTFCTNYNHWRVNRQKAYTVLILTSHKARPSFSTVTDYL